MSLKIFFFQWEAFTIDITQNIAIRYDTMHKRNVKFNTLQRGRQFVNERLLLLQQMRAWPVQQDDDRSETADTARAPTISNVVG